MESIALCKKGGFSAVNDTTAKNKLIDFFTNKQREKTAEEQIPMGACVLLSLASLVFCLLPPLVATGNGATVYVSWFACMLSAVLIFFTSRKFSSVIILGAVFTFLISYTGAPTLTAMVLGFVFVSGIFSAFVSSANKQRLAFILLLPVLSYAASLVITSNPISSLLSLAPIPAALAMGLATRRGLNRNSAIACFAAVTTAIFTILALVFVAVKFNGLSPSILSEAGDWVRVTLKNSMVELAHSAGNTNLPGSAVKAFGSLASSAVNLLFGTTVFISIITGYFVCRVQGSLFEIFDMEKLLNSSITPISMSIISSLIFIIAFVASYTTDGAGNRIMISAVADNICLILLPGLMAVGFDMMKSLPNKIGLWIAMLAWIALIILTILTETSFMLALAFTGAAYTVIIRIGDWAKDHYSKGENL